LPSLTEVGCHVGGPFTLLTVHVDKDTPVFFQAGALFGSQGGSLQFSLDVAPSPDPSFFFSPVDATVFDNIQFADTSQDPGQAGIKSEAWDFGDGGTATGCCPTHRFAADGDHSVSLAVTTFDGRTASTSRVVHVVTHDVAISKFTAPQAASAGQTRKLSVRIRNARYPETVEVQLLKSVPAGFQLLASQTANVPVRPSNHATTFDFSYTFTAADATIGKVTFKAVANLVDARDALGGDNEAIASTKVSH
jgi:PKD repeat protein